MTPQAPYVGLRPYDRDDRLIFHGRERDARFLTDKIFSAALTLLYGRSGLGKSSLLRAMVVPALEHDAAVVVYFDAWSGEAPDVALRSALANAASEHGVADAAAGAPTLSELVRLLCHTSDATVVLILDQFEEFLSVHGDRLEPVKGELAALLRTTDLDVRVLISMREEYLAALEPFRQDILNLFQSTYRLEPLDLQDTRTAIARPLERFDGSCESELIDSLVADLKSRKVDDTVAVGGAAGGVDLPMLQLVCSELWDAAKRAGSTTLTLALYRSRRGARGILDDYVKSVVPKQPIEQRVTADLLRFLAPPSGLKMSFSVADLASLTDLDDDTISQELHRLERRRILRTRKFHTGERFELHHDAYIQILTPWITTVRRGAATSKRRIRRLVFASVTLLLVGAGVFTITYARFTRIANDNLAALHAENGRTALLDGQFLRALVNLNRSCQLRCESSALRMLLAKALRGVPRTLARGDDAIRANGLWLDPDGRRVITRRTEAERQLDSLALWRVESESPDPLVLSIPTTGARDAAVRILATSRGGDWVLSLVDARALQLWDMKGEPIVHDMGTDAPSLRGGVLSDDGSRALVWSSDGFRILDTRSAQESFEVPIHDGLGSAQLSHDGRWIGTTGFDEIARVFSAADGEPVHALEHREMLESLSFSPDSRRIFTTTAEGTGTSWSVDRGEKRFEVKGRGPVAFSPDGARIATVSSTNSKTVNVWDGDSGALLASLVGHRNAVIAVTFDDSGERIATSAQDQTAKVWDTATGDLIVDLEAIGAAIEHVAFVGAGKVATLDAKGSVVLWHASKELMEWEQRVHESLRMVNFEPSGPRIVTAADQSLPAIWRTGTDTPLILGSAAGNADAVSDHIARFSPDGQLVVTAGADENARIWDAVSGARLRELAHSENVSVAEFSPDTASGYYLVTASDAIAMTAGDFEAHALKLWAPRSGKLVQTLTGHEATVEAVGFQTPNGNWLASGDLDGTVKIWDTRSGALSHTLSGHEDGLQWLESSPDGSHLASASQDGTARLWDARTGELLHTLTHEASVSSARFSKDGSRVVTACEDGSARIWSAATGALVQRFGDHTARVTSASFNHDDSRVVTSSDDGSSKVWSSDTGVLLAHFRHRFSVSSAAFSHDGSSILTAAGDGVIRVWDVHAEGRTPEEIREACMQALGGRKNLRCDDGAAK